MSRLSNLPPGCTDADIERQVAEPESRLDDIKRRDAYNRSTGTAANDRRYLLGLTAELMAACELFTQGARDARDALNGAGLACPSSIAFAAEKARAALAKAAE